MTKNYKITVDVADGTQGVLYKQLEDSELQTVRSMLASLLGAKVFTDYDIQPVTKATHYQWVYKRPRDSMWTITTSVYTDVNSLKLILQLPSNTLIQRLDYTAVELPT